MVIDFSENTKMWHSSLVYDVRNNMTATGSTKKIDLTRNRPRDPRYAARYRTANLSFDVSVIICSI
jgi:hypothetical protein